MPTTTQGSTDTTALRVHDGFSAGGAIMTYMHGATGDGFPDSRHIEASLEVDSPTVLIAADTGERVPHWAELDIRSAAPSSTGVILIQPAVRLRDATRYIVAIRNVRDSEGNVLPPTRAFKGLRDDLVLGDPQFRARRETYARIFERLEAIGVPKDELQIAWEFTTSSEASNTARLLHMRDESLARFGSSYASFVANPPQYDLDENIAIRIEGVINVPRYLDENDRIALDASGLPVWQRDESVRFFLEIPYAAASGGCRVLQYGHHSYIVDTSFDPTLRAFANEHCFVLFGMDLLGYRGEDTNLPSAVFASGDLSNFGLLPDMNQQALLNYTLGLRTVLRGLANHSTTFLGGHKTILEGEPTYFGLSEGGILGATYLALSPDIRRGVLASAGQPYTQIIQRSSAYTLLLMYWRGVRAPPRQYPLMLALLQLMWDHVDGSSYAHKLRVDRFSGTPEHDVLIINAIGDDLAPSISGEWMARNIGASNVMPVVRDVFGVSGRMGPFTGSGFVEIKFDDVEEPVGNLPAPYVHGRHLDTWKVPAARSMMATFLRDGTVNNACVGPCDPN